MRRATIILVIVFSLLIPILTISCDTTQPQEGEAVIDPEGGTLEIDDENHPLYGFKIEFPEGALNSSTLIQIRPVDDTGELPPYVESYCSPFEVLPSGLVFNEPVIMTIPFDFGALNDTDFIYVLLFDETNNEWGRCGVISYNYAESTVTVETIHFSEGVVAQSTVDFNQSVHTSPFFDRETDRFPIPQQGGECKGISVFVVWYFENVGQGLRNAYCDADRADDLAEHADFGLWPYFRYRRDQDKGAVAKKLWSGLRDDKCPQLLSMRESGTTHVHMVVVYKYEPGHFYILDPMYPGGEYTVEVVDGQLTHYDQYDRFRFESPGIISDGIMLATYSVYPPDSDCDGDARISITPSGTNPVGVPHVFTITVEKEVETSWTPAVGVEVTPTLSGVGAITSSGPYVTDSSGQVTVTVNSATPGTATVHASGTVTVGSVSISVATDDYGAYVVDNQKTWEDASLYARIGIFPPEDVNVVGDPHYLTAIVETSTNGIDWYPYGGTTVSFEVISGPGTLNPAITVTDTSGEATTTLSSALSGTSLVIASTTVYGFNIFTDGTGYNSDPAEKDWVDA